MPPDLIASSFPMGLMPGFKPMVVGEAGFWDKVVTAATNAADTVTSATTEVASKKKAKKVSVGKKKKS